jgi:gamma-glutamyltranspeptidase/glutathione hydrolase
VESWVIPDVPGRDCKCAEFSGMIAVRQRTSDCHAPAAGMKKHSATLAAGLALFSGGLMAQGFDRPVGAPFASRSEVIAQHGMVATSQPLATQIALDVLKRGGSAVDAAIAANAALGLMEPTGSGIGGDLFAIVWDEKSRRLHGLNASGRSPEGLTLEYLHSLGLQQIPPTGPLPLSVPGAVDGWYELHGRFGRLPMPELLQPAIDYARHGFPVSPVIAAEWRRNADILAAFPGFAATFMPGGRAPLAGEIFRNPRLADTYARLAREGRDAFYKGGIARSIVEDMRRHGGFLTEADFAAHHSEWVDPISTEYRGYTVWEMPPNTQGLAALQMLNILSGFEITSLGFGSADYLHLLIEAKKLAFEDRARFYADPVFARTPLTTLLAVEYAAGQRRLIDRMQAARSYTSGSCALDTGDTVYLAVGDRDGNMVSLIQSNYRGMGSGMTPADLGFVLQNRGELFTLEAGHANAYAPRKRPFHTIIPGFVTRDGYRYLAFGVMGGGMQPQGHVQVLVNLIDFGMGLQAAGDAARVNHEGSSEPTGQRMTDGGVVYLESGIEAPVRAALQARGHRLGEPGQMHFFGGYQAVMWDAEQGVYRGASEARKDGQAAGY